MELIGIDSLKRLPHHSSPSVGEIERQVGALVSLAAEKAASVHRVADLQELVSAARVATARDEVAVIRQVMAGLDELRAHFRQTIADGSIEIAQHRVKESLRKAEIYLKSISQFVAL